MRSYKCLAHHQMNLVYTNVPSHCDVHFYLFDFAFNLVLIPCEVDIIITFHRWEGWPRRSWVFSQLFWLSVSKGCPWELKAEKAPDAGNFTLVPNKSLLLELWALSTLNALGEEKTKAKWKSPEAFILVLKKRKKKRKMLTISSETSKTEYLQFSLWMFYIWEKG